MQRHVAPFNIKVLARVAQILLVSYLGPYVSM
jgi:hypothetical protein